NVQYDLEDGLQRENDIDCHERDEWDEVEGEYDAALHDISAQQQRPKACGEQREEQLLAIPPACDEVQANRSNTAVHEDFIGMRPDEPTLSKASLYITATLSLLHKGI